MQDHLGFSSLIARVAFQECGGTGMKEICPGAGRLGIWLLSVLTDVCISRDTHRPGSRLLLIIGPDEPILEHPAVLM